MSNSTDKMRVEVVPTNYGDGKQWVKVTLLRSRSFLPSFEDLFRIIQAICFCENEKYPVSHLHVERNPEKILE